MIYVSIILFVLLCLPIYLNVRLGLVVLRVEDSIEDCLDTIDEKYNSMSEVLQRPLFYDSPEVKAVVKDIQKVRDSLHSVALSLTKNIVDESEE